MTGVEKTDSLSNRQGGVAVSQLAVDRQPATRSDLPAGLGRRDRLRGVLGIRDFRLLLFASLAWYAARWIDTITTGWLALDLTGSPVFLAFAGAGRTLPMLLFGIVGGMLAERYPARRIVICALTASLTVLLWLAVSARLGLLVPWQLILATLLTNTGWALAFPAQRVLIANILGARGNVTTALALDQFANVGSNVVFSVVAGSLIPITGPSGAYLVGVVALLIGLPLAGAIRLRTIPDPGPGVSREPGSYRAVLMLPVVIGVVVISAVVNGLTLPLTQLLPLVARDLLNVGPVELGLLSSAWGGGTLLGALVLFLIAPRRGGALFIAGTFCASTLFFGFSFLSFFPAAAAVIFLAGILFASFGTYQSALIIETTTPAERPKALAALTVAIGMQPFGVITIGAIAGATTAETALRLGTGLAVIAIVAVALATPGLRRHVSGRVKSEE